MAAAKERSRVFTIRVPEKVAQQVEQVAKDESRNVSDLFREAFRAYRRQGVRSRLARDLDYARGRNRQRFTQDDVEQLVDQIRTELHAPKPGGK